MLKAWYRDLFGRVNCPAPKARPWRRGAALPLRLEVLEDRVVPSTFEVTNLADNGLEGSLRYAVNQANMAADPVNTILFNLGTGAHTINLTQGALSLINTQAKTVLAGPGADKLTISGGKLDSVFFVGGGAAVELDDLTITDGKSSSWGGGINNYGNLEVNRSTIVGNEATTYGGGIHNGYLATVNLRDSILERNTSYFGGGLFNYFATASVSGSTLVGNTAYLGGGIYSYDYATLNVSDSTLVGNTAYYFGGGIDNYNATVNINGSTLRGNSAGYNGGAIFSDYLGTVNVRDSALMGNGAATYGGGIYNYYATVNVNGSTLRDNTSSFVGGAIYNYYLATLNVSGSTLTGNTAYYGGGIYNTFATANIENSNLTGNSAVHYGGGLTNEASSTASISNSTLTGNTAGSGGGIYNINSSVVNLRDSTFTDNSAVNVGGGLSNMSSAIANIVSCILEGNTAGSGGGIYNYYAESEIFNSTFAGNTSEYGAGIYNFQSTVNVNNSTLAGNSATGDGGGIYNGYNSTTQLANTIVARNHAPDGMDVFGSFLSRGHNLIGSADFSSGFAAGRNGDIVGTPANPVDPGLGELADNGGPTHTMALLDGSLAINAGDSALIPIDPNTGEVYATDQRGSPRVVGSRVDIGAYESDVQESPQSITFNALPGKKYGDADFALTAAASSGLPVSYSATGNVSVYQDGSGNWFAHITGPGEAAITAFQAGNSYYFAAAPVSRTFTITAGDGTNVSRQIKAVASGLTYNPVTQLFGGTITLTNIGTATLTGQLKVVLTGLPSSVSLANASGTIADGNPYILVSLPSGGLAPGQSVVFTVKFKNPNRILLGYGLTTYEQTSGS